MAIQYDEMGNPTGSGSIEPEQAPAAKAPEYVRNPMGAPTRPQQAAAPVKPAVVATPTPAAPASPVAAVKPVTPAAATGAEATADTQTAATNPTAQTAASGMQGMGGGNFFMQFIVQMLMMFAGMMPQKTLQAKPVAPAMTASLAAAGAATPGTKPAGPVPTPAPSPAQVKAADNKIEADAKLAAATPPKPDTGVNTTTGVQPETDDQRRDRLGMSPNQYNKMAAEESEWQADARQLAGGAVGDSPFVRADRQDKMAQQQLGVDDIQWQALKKENKDWQTKKEAGDTTLAQTGPIQQAFAANAQKTALAAATSSAPVPTPTAAAPAVQPQIFVGPGQGTSGIAPRADGVIPTVVVGAPAAPVQEAPQRVYTERNNGRAPVDVIPQQYEQASYARPESRPTDGIMRGQFRDASGQNQLNRTLADRAELRAQGYDPKVASQMVENARRAELTEQLSSRGLDQRTIARTVDSTIRSESGMADRQEAAFARQDKAFQGQINQAAKQQQAMDARERAAYNGQVNQVSREAGRVGAIMTDGNPKNDSQAKGIIIERGVKELLGGGVLRGAMGGDGQGGSATPAQVQRDVNGWSRDAGRVGAIMTDGNPKNDSQAKGILIQRGVEGFLKGGVGVFQKMSFGGGNESAPQGRVVEYPAQSRGDYDVRPQTGKWDSNQITAEQRQASSYGATPEERAQILRDQEIQRTAQANNPNAPASDNTVVATSRRNDHLGMG